MGAGPWIKAESGRMLRESEITSIFYVADGDTDSYRVGCTTRSAIERGGRHHGLNGAPDGNQVWLCRSTYGNQTVLDFLLAIAQGTDTDLISTHVVEGKTQVRRGSLLGTPPPTKPSAETPEPEQG